MGRGKHDCHDVHAWDPGPGCRWRYEQSACPVLLQCWNDSKINAPQEISRGALRLKPWEQQGEARWVQRVKLTPAPRVKGYFSGGEITLELQYAQRVSHASVYLCLQICMQQHAHLGAGLHSLHS